MVEQMIEQVARRLFERQQSQSSDMGESEAELAQWTEYYKWDGPNFKGQEQFRSIARAAIEAMRELPDSPGPRYTAGEYSRRNHEAMIDDALSTAP